MKKERKAKQIWRGGFLVLLMSGLVLPALVQAKEQRSARTERAASSASRQPERQKEAPSVSRTEPKAERTEPARQEVRQQPQPKAQRESNSSGRVEQKQAAREAQRAEARDNAAQQKQAYQTRSESKRQVIPQREPQRTEVKAAEPVQQPEQPAAIRTSRQERAVREAPEPVAAKPAPVVRAREERTVREVTEPAAQPARTVVTFAKKDTSIEAGRPAYRPSGTIQIDPVVRKPGKRPQPTPITVVQKNVHVVQPVVVVERYTGMVHVERAPVPVYEYSEPCYDYDEYYPEEEYTDWDGGNGLYEGGYSYYNGNGVYIHQAGIPAAADEGVIWDADPVGGNFVRVTGAAGGYETGWYWGPDWRGQVLRGWLNPYQYYRVQYYWHHWGPFWRSCYSFPCWVGFGYCFLPF